MKILQVQTSSIYINERIILEIRFDGIKDFEIEFYTSGKFDEETFDIIMSSAKQIINDIKIYGKKKGAGNSV